MKSKRIIFVFAAVLLSAIFTSCGGVKLADTTWKGEDNAFDYELSFTKKEMSLSQISKYGREYDKEPMTVKYTVKKNGVYIISDYDGSENLYTTIDGNTMTFSDEYQTVSFTKVEEE